MQNIFCIQKNILMMAMAMVAEAVGRTEDAGEMMAGEICHTEISAAVVVEEKGGGKMWTRWSGGV